jgi:hypothetical protein
MAAYTQQDDDFLRSNYLTMPAKRMSAALGRCEGSAIQRMRVLRLVVPKEIAENFKQQSQFKKGGISSNKGKKQSEYMSAAAIKNSLKTRFKKGQRPHNTLFDGKITVRKNKSISGEIRMYKWVRISKRKWTRLHLLKWEKKHGPVPPGYIIVFKDKDTMNVKLSNLEMITLAENMRRNTIHNYPPELKQSLRIVSKLKRKIKKHEEQIN